MRKMSYNIFPGATIARTSCGRGSGVEHRLAKARVASSNLVVRLSFLERLLMGPFIFLTIMKRSIIIDCCESQICQQAVNKLTSSLALSGHF